VGPGKDEFGATSLAASRVLTAGRGIPSLPPLPASRLLIGGRRLLLLPRLIGLVGLNEAIVLQQVRYYLEDERAPRVAEGRRWVRAPIARWQARDFPFWTTRTVERTFASLVANGLIVARQLDIRSGDATNSYSIDWGRLSALERDTESAASGIEGEVEPTGQPTALPPLPASVHLDEEDLLPIGVRLAELIGLDEAVVLRQIYYWLGDRRRPPARDGRRWVCPAQVPFWESLAFRSRKTIQRALQQLEHRGLLISSTAYNASPRDRTKWYSVGFECVEALENPSLTPEASSKNPECRDGSAQNVGIERDKLTGSSDPKWHDASDRFGGMQATEMARSLKDSETDGKIDQKEEQPTRLTRSGEISQVPENVVVTASSEIDLVSALVSVGLTQVVGRRLLATHGASHVRRHLDIHTWECAEQPDRAQLTPGRLRRRIEEDWAPPPGYMPPEERATQQATRAAFDRQRTVQRREHEAARADENREQRERLMTLGLRAADQAIWGRLAHEGTPLPLLFRQALFHAPAGNAPAALIFLERTGAERAASAAQRASRATVAARLTRAYGRSVDIHYLCYDDVVRLIHEADDSPTDSDSPATTDTA